MKEKKILVVDDDGLVLSTFGKGLADHGYNVLLADSGEEALRLAVKEQQLDLAILDIRMPGISGLETAQGLKRLGIASMFLSAYDDKETVQQAVKEGALGYLVKPFDVEKAIPAIESALQRALDIQGLFDTKQRLDTALETGNQVNVVIGMLMERHHLPRQDAFELLRANARSSRRKVKDVAEEMLSAWNTFNLLSPASEKQI